MPARPGEGKALSPLPKRLKLGKQIAERRSNLAKFALAAAAESAFSIPRFLFAEFEALL